MFIVLEKTMVSAIFLCARKPFTYVYILVLVYVYNAKPLNVNGNGQNFSSLFLVHHSLALCILHNDGMKKLFIIVSSFSFILFCFSY